MTPNLKPIQETEPGQRIKPQYRAWTRQDTEDLIRALHEWMADESGYDEETWPELKKALEANRSSSRSLFGDR